MVVGFVVFWGSGYSQRSFYSLHDRIDSLLQACQSQGLFNGTALVVDDGQTILRKGYGLTSPVSGGQLQPEDVFNIGSITKQFTAFLVLRLYEDSLLHIHDPITQYLDAFNRSEYEKVSVYHLLTHTSGIPNYTSNPSFDPGYDYSDQEMYSLIQKPLQFEPGERYAYCNSGYFILGKILEKVSGVSYGDLLQREIFTPLKMSHSFVRDSWPEEGIVQGYWRTVGGMAPMPTYSCYTLYAAGGIFSNVDDLLKWEQALYDEAFLSTDLRALMFAPYKHHYACGWHVRKGYANDGTYYERHFHGGMIKGYHAFIFRRIPQGQTIILLDNNHNQEIQEIKNSIWRILEDGPIRVPIPKLSNFLFQACADGTLETQLDSVRDFPDYFQSTYKLEEYDINTVGYRLMDAERYDEAEAVLKFNVDRYPEAWNVYDSIGELYLRKGKLRKARKMYLKSLELNSENTSAEMALERISTKMGK